MNIPKMATQVPSILENALAQRERAVYSFAHVPLKIDRMMEEWTQSWL